MHIPGKCVTNSTGRQVKATEKKKTFTVLNPDSKQVARVKVDGCVVTDSETPRCDYFFEIGAPVSKVLYVELKGKNLTHACDQLANSLKLFASRHGKLPRHCYVVASRIPTAGPSVQLLMKKFFTDYKVHVRFKSRVQEISV